jgi:hypothetical protein
MPFSRRKFIKRVTASSALFLSRPTLSPAELFNGAQVSHLEGLPSLDEIWEWETYMAGLGTRWTGSSAHTEFVEFLADEFARTGCTVDRLHYTFPFWEAGETSIAIGTGRGTQVPVSGHFRQSNQSTDPTRGSVTATTVTAPLVYGGTFPNLDLINAAGKILYFDHPLVPEPYTPPAPGALFTTMATFPPGTPFPPPGFQPPPQPIPPGTTDNAAYGSFNLAGFSLPAGYVGTIVGWTDISEENALYQNFGFGTGGRPGLYVGPSAGDAMRKAAQAGTTATMTLDARVTPNTPTDTIFATLPGLSDEIIIVNTHTDGPNFTEENGSLAILALARHLSRIPLSNRKRTFVFVMVTGHLTPPYFVPWENAGFINSNPDIIAKTVAGLTIEHLGAMEWCDDEDLQYRPTGLVETTICPTNPLPGKTTSAVAGVLLNALQHSGDSRVALTNGVFLGLGGAFYAAGIPMIGHIPVPNYLLAAPPDGYIDKANARHMYEQIKLFASILRKMDAMRATELQGT